MHNVTVRQEIVDRVLTRRGRYHWFDRLDPLFGGLAHCVQQGKLRPIWETDRYVLLEVAEK